MLGFYVSNSEDNQVLNFTETSGKIKKIINYWKRFDLSMIGRITVIKTLILPHVGFVSTILKPPDQWAEKLNNVCENFVLGNEKVAKAKLYISPKMGGLGLINMDDFIKALKCCWFKKAMLSTNDNWKITLRMVTENFSNLYSADTSKLECGEVLLNILEAVQFFIKKWDATENNFLSASIVGNTNFGYGTEINCHFNENFFKFGTGYSHTVHVMRTDLSWKLLTSNGNFESREYVNNVLGFDLPEEKYVNLKTGYERAVKKFFKVGGKEMSYKEFFSKTKNSDLSRKIRMVMNNILTVPGPVKKQLENFAKSINIEFGSIIPTVRINWLGAWAYQLAPIEVRMFNFRFFSNKILTNDKKSHFSEDTSAACDFCVKAKNLPAPKETLLHFFWDCPVSNSLIKHVWERKFANLELNPETFFTGITRNLFNNGPIKNFWKCCFTFGYVTRYTLWEYKYNKKFPGRLDFDMRVTSIFGMICRLDRAINTQNTTISNLLQS
jgi:hypothetical protein